MTAEYAFHQLVRAVAYEAQLKSSRAELHRQLASAIERREPDLADENAALIAEHLAAAGDLHAAYKWHCVAGVWSTTVTSRRRRRIGNAHKRSPTGLTPMTPTGSQCGSRPARCYARMAGASPAPSRMPVLMSCVN